MTATAGGARRQVLVYELNEVPWEIVDWYVAQRPGSAMARLMPRATSLTTVSEERQIDLQPWRTWPSFHRSLWTRDHNSWDVGQDPETFRGVDMWTTAARAGLTVGVFGALQSWPARRLGTHGFYVPDTFAQTPATVPAALKRYQAFNLAMTAENRFAPTDAVRLRELPVVGADLLRQGLSVRSTALLARQLIAERLDPDAKQSRAVMQAVPAFDLFWRLQQRRRPVLSVFFTNHVASMLHRYWADTVVDDDGRPTPGARLVLDALDLFDRHLARMSAWVAAMPGAVLVVASGMGQGRIAKRDLADVFVVDDLGALGRALELDDARPSPGMYPAQSIVLLSDVAAREALSRLMSVRHERGPMFRELRANGRTASFEVDYLSDAARIGPRVEFEIDGGRQSASVADLGIVVRRRPGGGNTGEHIGRGILVAAGSGFAADDGRREIRPARRGAFNPGPARARRRPVHAGARRVRLKPRS